MKRTNMQNSSMTNSLDYLISKFGADRIETAIKRIGTLPIEVPSWGFSRGGTRFATYSSNSENEPTTCKEKIKLAGIFHRLTGKGKSIALHFPWDGDSRSEIRQLRSTLHKEGISAGSVNANLFTQRFSGPLNATLRFGSLTHPDAKIRKASIKHCLECIEYMRILSSHIFVLWLPDGTNSPGQMSMYDQASRLEESLREVVSNLSENEIMLIEYKLFEPGFYSTAIQDYGRALYLAWLLGNNVKVLVDLGHHAHGVNVEQIVSHLLRQGKLGGFHFNDSCYADDDLASGSLHPHKLFRIFVNLIEGEMRGYTPVHDLALMIDQSHNIKEPFEELIESVENIETAYAKALLVNFDDLKKAQDALDPIIADRILMDAFNADVRPLILESRYRNGLPLDPLSEWRKQK